MVTSENVADPKLLIGCRGFMNNNTSVFPSLQNIYTFTPIGPHRREDIQSAVRVCVRTKDYGNYFQPMVPRKTSV